jgi:hypothetical protein
VKRFWLHYFALSIGLVSATDAFAQYPMYSTNTGPSSFPVSPNEAASSTSPVSASLVSTGQNQGYNSPYGSYVQDEPSAAPSPYQQNAYSQPTTPANYAPLPMVPPPSSMASQSSDIPSIPASAGVFPGEAPSPNSGRPVAFGYGGVQSHSATGHPTAPSIGWEDNFGPGGATATGSLFGGGHLHAGHFCGVPAHAKPWFFGGGVLIFQRVDDYNRLLSVDDAGDSVLYTGDARNRTMAGFEILGGRYFNGGRNALAVSYWGLFPETQAHSVFDGGAGLNTTLFGTWDGVDPFTGEFQLDQTGTGLGDPLTDTDIGELYNTASGHRVRRNSTFHNVEINLLGFAAGGAARNFNRPVAGGCCHGGHCGTGDACNSGCRFATGPCCYIPPACGSCLNFSWLAGIRYLQIQDDFEHAALGVPGLGAETLMYQVCTTNHLVGFQLGGRADYCIGNRLNLFGLARAGVYNNSASLCTSLGTETASAYTSNDPDSQYVFSRRTDRAAFLGEIGTGLGWALTAKWTATVGYRAIFANGVATSVGNLRHQGQTIAQTGINAKDSLVLHGLNIGALYNF